MKYISLLLHMYQPPTQDISLVSRIDRECYTPLARLLADTGAKIAVNINYSLTQQLEEIGSSSIAYLVDAGGIEFTDSAAYHTILPLAGDNEAARQLILNREGNAGVFGECYDPTGVFPPEMAYSPDLPHLLLRMGYKWTITDDVPWVYEGNPAPNDFVPSAGGLPVLLRSNFWSNRISFHGDNGTAMLNEIMLGMEQWAGDRDSYIMIAMDGETFGHHRNGAIETFLDPFLSEFARVENARLVTPGELIRLFPIRECLIPSGSWSTTPSDLDNGKPWPLWNDRDNPLHVTLRELRDRVLGLARSCGDQRVASLADKMLYSCPFWWASQGRFDAIQVRRGLLLILETAQATFTCTGDRKMLDKIMKAACSIPVITGEETNNA